MAIAIDVFLMLHEEHIYGIDSEGMITGPKIMIGAPAKPPRRRSQNSLFLERMGTQEPRTRYE